MPEQAQPANLWIWFALATVACWGLYGILLHAGQVGMGDPQNGRYKAFFWVGMAYFLIAVLARFGMQTTALVAILGAASLASGSLSSRRWKSRQFIGASLSVAARRVSRAAPCGHGTTGSGRCWY